MIDLNKPIDNKDRKFGSANTYFITKIKQLDGSTKYGLLTQHEVDAATKRADNNVEDIVANATVFGKVVTWFTKIWPSSRQ